VLLRDSEIQMFKQKIPVGVAIGHLAEDNTHDITNKIKPNCYLGAMPVS
jgi:hypothetical protein